MKKQLYLDIVSRLKTIVDVDDNPIFKHFDLWNRQVEFLEQETPFDTPAIFIEFMAHSWNTQGKKRQDAELAIRIHVVTRFFTNTADYNPQSNQALDYLNLTSLVVACLQGADMSKSNAFVRTSSVPNHNHVGYLDSIEEYKTHIWDDAAVKLMEPVEVVPHVLGENQTPHPDPDPPLPVATYLIFWSDGEKITEGTIPAPGQKLITILRPESASWELQNSEVTKLSEGIIQAGDHDVIPAPDATYDLEFDDETPIETGSIPSGKHKKIVIEKPPCPDAEYTLLNTADDVLETGVIPSGTFKPITAPDATYVAKFDDDSPIESGNIGAGRNRDIVVSKPAIPSGWNPPDDWGWEAASNQVTDADNAFVGIYACFPNIDNTVAILCTFSGTATVDWGDGSASESVTSGVIKEHNFTYAGIAKSITSWGFKPCVVLFKSTGECSVINLYQKHSMDKLNASSNWMALKIRSQYNGATPFQYPSINAQNFPYNLHLLDFGNTLKVRAYGMFQYHKSLQKLIYNFGLNDGIVAATSMFSYSNVYNVDWNNYDWSNWTDLSGAWFNSYTPTPYALEINVNSCSLITGAFRQCYCFSSIKLINSANITNISFALYNNGQVMSFEMDDASGVTTTTSFLYSQVNNLKRIIMPGLRVGIDLTGARLNAEASNAFYNSLGTANGSQTILMVGVIDPGDITIAQNKGFIVNT